jgi:Protein of unknown function (DUF1499)
MASYAQTTGPWTSRFSRWALYGGIVALILTVGGAFLAGQGVLPKLTGLNLMFGGALLSILGMLFGLLGIGLNARSKGGMMKAAVIGTLLTGGQAGFMLSRAVVASKVPAIHDITTDLANPPAFSTLKLGADNLRGVGSAENWRELHSAGYADLKPILTRKAASAVIADAERLAKERGWVIAKADPDKGVLEATASVSLIKFQDDIVLRVTPTEDGTGSRVDMRSVSRIGMSDLGVNAKRIHEFLAALSKS